MSVNNNTTKNKEKQYSHLTKDKRIQIQTLINLTDEFGQRQYSNADIARIINVHRSTITRELRRIKSKINIRSGKIKNKPYNAHDAQEDYLFKRGLSKANYLVEDFPKLKKFIEDKILIDKWAPDVISGYTSYICKSDSQLFLQLQFIVPYIMVY